MMSQPLLYDVFCGAGGCSRGYQLAGFRVVGVDNRPQPRYCGDEFIQMDAFEFFERCRLGEYPPPDAWHCSPPCQNYSALHARYPDKVYPDLVDATRAALIATGKPYVIENVMSAPLTHGVTLCGGMFGLRTYRHRRFESSVLMFQPHHPRHVIRTSTKKRRRDWDAGMHTSVTGDVTPAIAALALGIDWMDGPELAQAIPPAYCQWIGTQLIAALQGVPS